MTNGASVDRNKLLLKYQKLLNRLDNAEKWATEHGFSCEDVEVNKNKIWLERDNIIKDIEFVRELLGLE